MKLEDIYQQLFEELNIVLNETIVKQAEEILANPEDREEKELEQLSLSVRRYKEFRDFFVEFNLENDLPPDTSKQTRERYEAIYAAYKKGEADGFFRCLCIVLYAVYNTTSYKNHGLFSILDKTFFLDNAMETEGCIITLEMINMAMFEETRILCYTAFRPQVEEYLKEFEKTGQKKGYVGMIDEALKTYIDGFYVD